MPLKAENFINVSNDVEILLKDNTICTEFYHEGTDCWYRYGEKIAKLQDKDVVAVLKEY